MAIRSDLFLDVCRNVRHGDLVRELGEALAEAVRAAEASGKAGEVTLKLAFKPNGRGQMILKDTVNSKAPKPDAGASLMFNDVHGNLSRRDPNQQALGLKDAASDKPAEEERSHGTR